MWTTAVLSGCLLVILTGAGLEWLNLRHVQRRGDGLPATWAGPAGRDPMPRGAAYAAAQARLALAHRLSVGPVTLVFLFGGWLGRYDTWIHATQLPSVLQGVLFFLGLHLAAALLEVPFRLYRTFGIEERFGFNTTTPGLWVTDTLKSAAVAALLLGLLSAGALALIHWEPDNWWLWVWGFVTAFMLTTTLLGPYLIEPLFVHVEPVADPELARRARELASRAGVRVDRVLQIDASRRSRHSNAYFTGVGPVKRIVLFDTLLQALPREQVLAVLAHELGHWKLRHLPKRLAATLGTLLVALLAASWMVAWEALPTVVGLASASLPARLLIAGSLGSLLAFWLQPLGAAWSRAQERQADRFAVACSGHRAALSAAILALARGNLSNPRPHPLYVWFHYTHPPLPERLQTLAAAPERGSETRHCPAASRAAVSGTTGTDWPRQR